jgi:hypothetical protein
VKENEVEKEKHVSFFSVIPYYVLSDTNISDSSKVLYGVISSLTKKEGYCWANNRYLCNFFKVSIREIQKRLSELRDGGYIKIEFYVSDGDRKIWIIDPMNKCSLPHEQMFMTPCPNVHTYNIIDNNKDITTLAQTNELFDLFWKAYPKKKSKGDAEKVFKKIRPDKAMVDSMICAIESQKDSYDWKKDEGKYIPYPATWINAKGWLDEISNNTGKTLHDKNNKMLEEWNAGKLNGLNSII